MEWKKVDKEYFRHDDCPLGLPKDRVFLGLWKGRIVLTEFCDVERRFYVIQYPTNVGPMRVEQDMEDRFDYWMPLPEYPDEYRFKGA